MKKYNVIAVLWGVMFILTAAGARASAVQDKQVRLDTASVVNVRSFSSRELTRYRRSPDFQYEKQADDTLSWWDRLKQWFWQKLAEVVDAGTHTGMGKLILILLVAGVVIYVIIRMAGIDKGGLLGKKNEDLLRPYVSGDDIHAVDFDQAINTAVRQDNYRLAIRLWYLKTLKKLADKEIIQWRPGKTNHEYVTELDGTPYSPGFARLTNDFEYCWYGEKAVAAAEYEMLKIRFADFNQQLSLN